MEIVMEQIVDVFDKTESITVTRDGVKERFVCGDATYEIVLENFGKMIKGSRQMPAFGVSLDNETRTAMKSGVWVEFDFGRTLFCNEMPFERLLLQLNENYQGINLARYNAECGYHGRCFYLDLNGNTNEFYKLIKSL